MRVAMMLVMLLARFIAAAACGGSSGSGSSQSSADKAKNEACAAKSDLNAQITTLKNLTFFTASVDTANHRVGEDRYRPQYDGDCRPGHDEQPQATVRLG